MTLTIISSSCFSVWSILRIASTTAIMTVLASTTTKAAASAFVASPRTNHQKKIRSNLALVALQHQTPLPLPLWMSPFDEFDSHAPSSSSSAASSRAPASWSGAHVRIVTLESHADLLHFWNPNKHTVSPKEQQQEQPPSHDDNDDRIAIVLVHAKWCKSCHKVWEHYRKLARDQADGIDNRSGQIVRRGRVRLASIEWSAHTDLCRHVLGVTRLPTVVFYGPGGRVLESFAAGPTKFAELIAPTLERLWLEQRLEQGAAMIEQAVVGTTSQSSSSLSAPLSATPEQVAREWNWSNQ